MNKSIVVTASFPASDAVDLILSKSLHPLMQVTEISNGIARAASPQFPISKKEAAERLMHELPTGLNPRCVEVESNLSNRRKTWGE
jgi:hypothetical protein